MRTLKVWHSPPSLEQRRTGLFADYVNTWLNLKQESAGWPSWCQTVEQKRDYILRYQGREEIRMDISHIAKNPGHRATAKLMLNRYSFHVLFHVVIAPLLIFLFIRAVCGANLVNRSTSPLPSPSKIRAICSVYYTMPPLTPVPSDCAPTSWRPCT